MHVWRNFASVLTAQTSQEERGMCISEVEWEYCLPEERQEPLERVEKADHRLAPWQFEQEEVGKWNHVGIVSSFGAATPCKKPLLLFFFRCLGK